MASVPADLTYGMKSPRQSWDRAFVSLPSHLLDDYLGMSGGYFYEVGVHSKSLWGGEWVAPSLEVVDEDDQDPT